MDYGTVLLGLLGFGTALLALVSINEAWQERRERKAKWIEAKSEEFEKAA